ncbi:MAG: hypothetical protein AAGH79_13670, partial [Bacteroidota bacterium]
MALFPSFQRSGFDLEALLGAEAFENIFRTIYEAGDFPLQFSDTVGPLSFDLRIYEPESVDRDYPTHPDYELGATHPDSFKVLLEWPNNWFDPIQPNELEPHLILQLYTDLEITLGSGEPTTDQATLDLFMHLGLEEKETADGLEVFELGIQILDINVQDNNNVAFLLDSQKALILARLNASLSGVLGDNTSFPRALIQRIEVKRHDSSASNAAALGVYLNFNLQNGPEANDLYSDDRADIDRAENILPSDQSFAVYANPDLYDMLASHVYQQFAVKQRNGKYEYEIDHKEEDDKPAKLMINKVRLKPIEGKYKLSDGSKSEKTPGLELLIKGEYVLMNFGEWEVIEPDFKVILRVYPEMVDGELIWHTDHELKLNILAGVVQVLIFSLVALTGAMGQLIFGQTLGLIGLIEKIVAPVLERRYLRGRIQTEKSKATQLFQESIQRLTILTKRWDPFYSTRHQTVLVFSTSNIGEAGLYFDGNTRISRSFAPTEDVYIRATDPINERTVNQLRYKVPKHGNRTLPATPVAPATDRLSYTETNTISLGQPFGSNIPDDERNILILSQEQVQQRIYQGKLLASIPYRLVAVRLEENQVISIKSISDYEAEEIEQEWIDRYEEEIRQEIAPLLPDDLLTRQAEAIFIAMGIGNPTEEMLEELKEALFDEAVDERLEERV